MLVFTTPPSVKVPAFVIAPPVLEVTVKPVVPAKRFTLVTVPPVELAALS